MPNRGGVPDRTPDGSGLSGGGGGAVEVHVKQSPPLRLQHPSG